MYFTLAISAVTSEACAALVTAAQRADPRAMPIPGPARLAWRSPDERAAVLHWGAAHGDAAEREAHRAAASHAGTIWIGSGVLHARTGVARVDPVYVAETPGAVVVSDRASWAAAATGRLNDHDPVMVGAFLSLGYPMGAVTPFRRVRAMDGGRMLRATSGRLVMAPARHEDSDTGPGGSALVGAALVEAVSPLGGPGRQAGRAGRAVPDRRQGQPADRRRADSRGSAVPRPHARFPQPSRCRHRGHDRRAARRRAHGDRAAASGHRGRTGSG